MIQLWDFQQTLIQRLRDSLRSGYKSPLLVSPTGSGKTVMFAYLTMNIARYGQRTVILAHRKELLDQISRTLGSFDVGHRLIAPKHTYDARPLTHVASVFSAVRKLQYIHPPDYVIVDEAHHAINGSTWGNTLTFWRKANPNLRVFGVTATPERLSGEGLGDMFDTMVMGPTVAELIADGYLSPYKMFAPPRQIDMTGVHRRMGDFVRKEAEEVMDKAVIHGNAIQHYKKHLNGAPAVAFCVSIAHAEHFAEQCRREGLRAVSIDGKLSDKERNARTSDFSAGKLNVLASCDLISEGYDVPGMMGCINLRPTESLALCLQQWGRTLRRQHGKVAIILDHVGNSFRHGLPDDDREWTLEGRPRKKSNRDPDDISVRNCTYCGAVNRSTNTHCSECGSEFVIKARKIDEVEGELQEVEEDEKLNFRRMRARAQDLNALVELGKLRGMKNPHGWARHVLEAREKKRGR